MPDISQLLDSLLSRDPDTPELADLTHWWVTHLGATGDVASPAHRAVLAGFMADRAAYAFASGYVEAVAHLLDDAAPERRALCATEAGGGHPRAIECRLETGPEEIGTLSGEKTFVTLGGEARELLIVARTGTHPDGRPHLQVARIPSDREGVRIQPLPELPFVPEISHAKVELRGVRVRPEELLPGDGYLEVLKPFRTIEDTHVHLAFLGWMTRLARRYGWAPASLEALLSLVTALVPLAHSRSPLSRGVHRALDPLLTQIRHFVDALPTRDDGARLPEPLRARLARDRPLLDIAAKTRARRLEAARAADD